LISCGADGAVYLNARNFGDTKGHRLSALSFNGGDTFEQFKLVDQLIEPVTKDWTGVVGSIER
jgi:hypothetical protein